MSEVSLDSIIAIAGVITGFSLSQGAEVIKAYRKNTQIKKAVRNELIIIKEKLQSATNDKETSTISSKDFPFITVVYDALKADLASSLKPEKITLVNRAYKYIAKLNTDCKKEPRGFFETMADTVIFQHDISEDITILQEAIEALA